MNAELLPRFGKMKLQEIGLEDLRALADHIVERGAPATAVHARELVFQIFRWAIERGQKVDNLLSWYVQPVLPGLNRATGL